jgi:hypothetical protein
MFPAPGDIGGRGGLVTAGGRGAVEGDGAGLAARGAGPEGEVSVPSPPRPTAPGSPAMKAEDRETLEAFCRRLVYAGYETPEQMLASAVGYLEGLATPAQVRRAARPLLARLLAEHAREQASWPAVTDCDRLDRAFAELERAGILARQDFSCCRTCGAHDLRRELVERRKEGLPSRGFVFFHVQGTERVVETGELLLEVGEADRREKAEQVSHLVVDALQRHGLRAVWGGDWHEPPIVRLDWKRRRP